MITLAKPVSTSDLVEAIAVACSPVFGAMNMANAIAGAQTDVWRLIREFTLTQLIDDAAERGVDLSAVKAVCCDVLVFDTPPFRDAVDYDPRPRCPLCARRHLKPRDGTELSCGDAGRFRNPPPNRRWTRSTAEAAVEGTYTP